MPDRHARPTLVLLIAALAAGCAPLVPQSSVDRVPVLKREAAFRIPVFETGGDTAPPAAVTVIAPIEAHSCQFWEFSDAPTQDDALKRLQLAALAQGADGIVDLRFEADKGNRWDSRCWDSLAARGTAVKFDRTVAAAPLPSALTAAAPAAQPPAAGTVTAEAAPNPAAAAATASVAEAPAAGSAVISSQGDTIVASGSGRAELMDWIRRLGIPRSSFIARGPGDGNLDWLDGPAEIGSWNVRLPKSTQAASLGTTVTASGVALVPEVSELRFTSRQLGYDMTGTWTWTRNGTWNMSDRYLRRLP